MVEVVLDGVLEAKAEFMSWTASVSERVVEAVSIVEVVEVVPIIDEVAVVEEE